MHSLKENTNQYITDIMYKKKKLKLFYKKYLFCANSLILKHNSKN